MHICDLIKNQETYRADADQTVLEVAQAMVARNIGAVPVLRDGLLVGIFSERDLMKRVVAAGLNPEKTLVANVMTKDLVVGRPDDDINAALQKMHSLGCRHLPVVDSGNLIGMISLRDLLEIDDDTQRKRVSFLSELVTYSPDYES